MRVWGAIAEAWAPVFSAMAGREVTVEEARKILDPAVRELNEWDARRLSPTLREGYRQLQEPKN